MARTRANSKQVVPLTKPLLSAKRLEDLRKFSEELVALCRKYHFELGGSECACDLIEVYDGDEAALPEGFTYVGSFTNVAADGIRDIKKGRKIKVKGIVPGEWFQDGPGDPIWAGPKE